MNWLKGFFGKEEEAPIAAAETAVPSNDDITAPETVVTSGKIKLNFKKLPKKVVQAMADETTGQEIDRSREDDTRRRDRDRGGLTDAFNGAASPRAAAASARDLAMRPALAPMRPRMPSPSP